MIQLLHSPHAAATGHTVNSAALALMTQWWYCGAALAV